MAIKIGISGFGRISRVVIRAAMDMPEIEIAGINVRNADKEYMVYMLKYDTVFGRFPKELGVYDDGLIIDGKKIPVYSESDASLKEQVHITLRKRQWYISTRAQRRLSSQLLQRTRLRLLSLWV